MLSDRPDNTNKYSERARAALSAVAAYDLDDTHDTASRLPAGKPGRSQGFFSPARPNSTLPESPLVPVTGGDYADTGRAPGTHQEMTTMKPFATLDNSSCDPNVAQLSAYLDGELDSEQTRAVTAHLNDCPNCAGILTAMQETDETIEREWRESAPLPSSLRGERSIDNIMAALPSVPRETIAFAAHRVHARARWMRFAGGMAGALALLLSLWSSYQWGYANGRRNAAAFGSALNASVPSAPSVPVAHSALLSERLSLAPAALLVPAPASAVPPAPAASVPVAPATAPCPSLASRAPVSP